LANSDDEPENALVAAWRVAEVLAPVKATVGAMSEASMMNFMIDVERCFQLVKGVVVTLIFLLL
jgi:hypothetical protein